MADQDAAPQGKHILFLPSRLHASSSAKVLPNEFPLLGHNYQELPLPDPLRRTEYGYPSLRNKPMHRAPLHTQTDKTTKISESVENLTQSGSELAEIQLSRNLWSNLVKYADKGLGLEGREDLEIATLFRDDISPENQQFSTWTARGTRPLPPATQQVDAIYGISAWFNMVADRPEAIVNCELAVQDEIHTQMMEPLNIIARMRFPNTVMDPLKDPKGENWDTPYTRNKPAHATGPINTTRGRSTNTIRGRGRVKFRTQTASRPRVQTRSSTKRANQPEEPIQPVTEPETTPGPPGNAFMPCWGRSTYATHMDSRKVSTPANKKEESSTPAGYPDFLYFISASFGDYGCLGEAKTPWAIKDSTVQVMYESAQDFEWKEKSVQCEVWRQIWGELDGFSAQWGFFTNGSKIFVFVKPDPEGNVLVMSEPHDWTGEDVLLALAGLMFASVDAKDMERNIELNLFDILCPEEDRLEHWDVPGAPPN